MTNVILDQIEQLSYAKKEAFNSLRTNISFCGDDIKVILFTSCDLNEGKSSTVVQLGHSMADAGKRVLIIDADLRKSVLVGRYHAHKVQEEEEEKSGIAGMSHYLTGQVELAEALCSTNISNLHIIFAGRMVPNPTELLGNAHMTELLAYARSHYDIVLIDTPPLGSVIDTAVLAPKCDGVIIIVESGKNSYRFLQNIKNQLDLTGCRILGTVLNKVHIEKNGYYGRYYKGSYSKYYGDIESNKEEETMNHVQESNE